MRTVAVAAVLALAPRWPALNPATPPGDWLARWSRTSRRYAQSLTVTRDGENSAGS